jgi:Flp pilus assembly protein TadB
MGRHLELRDLRSLERASMYSIFHPLDPNERLPRELILEGRRHRLLDGRHLEIAALFVLPGLVVVIVALGAVNLPPGIVYGVAGVLFAGFFAFAFRYRRG